MGAGKSRRRDEATPLSDEDVLKSPMVSDPLSRLDCCLVSDGGAAIVMTSAARARDLKQPPVFVLGAATATGTATSPPWPT